MGQSLVKNLIHLVYSTKHRKPWIAEEIQRELWAYQAGICANLESPAIVIGGVRDHVHILFSLSKNVALKTVVEELKKCSSKWMKTKTGNKDFYWQSGYSAFSVGQSQVVTARRYVERQKEHHRTKTFQEELREFFARYEIKINEQYVWD